ncbi:hypothetical protein Droror1_Dr00003321 [Drosera rotundifolia]
MMLFEVAIDSGLRINLVVGFCAELQSFEGKSRFELVQGSGFREKVLGCLDIEFLATEEYVEARPCLAVAVERSCSLVDVATSSCSPSSELELSRIDDLGLSACEGVWSKISGVDRTNWKLGFLEGYDLKFLSDVGFRNF